MAESSSRHAALQPDDRHRKLQAVRTHAAAQERADLDIWVDQVEKEINAHGKVIDFAMDFFEIKKHMKGEGPRAIKAAMNSFIKLSRTQFTTTEASILWVVDGPILNAYGIAGSNIPHA
ncbi:hypothetical protein EN45_114110 [Penicillium chrysogenum]|uniref:Uncharacterized protein n=1 Tax=Penicillium chrysogenum TaxID=5076 RepID=A0A167Q4G2_PENCH|nr:hypothetical protein EN45_114110 [Penicillium chrysogenum]